MRLRVGLLQMPVIRGRVKENETFLLERLAGFKPGALDMLCLPEMWTTDFVAGQAKAHAQQSREALNHIQREAKRLRLVVVGSVLEADRRKKGSFYNSFFWLDGKACLFPYRKIHLFRPLGEHRNFRAGLKLGQKKFRGESHGLTICYDARFPELYRALAHRGCTVIWVPAAWPASRIEHWKTLLRARAIENQVFILGVNRVGASARGFAFGGHSVALSPWGEVLWEGSGKRTELGVVELETAQVAGVQRKITVWQDRRPDLYQSWMRGRKP